MTKSAQTQARQQKLAAKLKENLARRKRQAKARRGAALEHEPRERPSSPVK